MSMETLLEELIEKDPEDAQMLRGLLAMRQKASLISVLTGRAASCMDAERFIRAIGEGNTAIVVDACRRALELKKLASKVSQEVKIP